jgi:CRP-like cAMP-binding protein
VPLFVDWNKHEVEEIARLFNEHRFSKGETVVKEGSVGDSFFLIDSGEAGVFIGGKGRTTLKPGDYFGEIALIDDSLPHQRAMLFLSVIAASLSASRAF